MTTQTLSGPNGLRLVLDSAQIFPDDPGQGTPAMVYHGNASATYWCACGEGELLGPNCEGVPLSYQQNAWLEQQEDMVNEFIEKHDPA